MIEVTTSSVVPSSQQNDLSFCCIVLSRVKMMKIEFSHRLGMSPRVPRLEKRRRRWDFRVFIKTQKKNENFFCVFFEKI